MAEVDTLRKETLAQLANLINEGATLNNVFKDDRYKSEPFSDMPEARLRAFVTLAVAVIERTAGRNSQYYQSIPITRNLEALADSKGKGKWIISTITGVLYALHTAVNQGLLVSIESTLRASIHDDFLVQASELLASGYYVPAFMLTSAVLESHLNKMTQARGLPVTGKRSLSKYNDLLRNDSAYNQSLWRRIQSIGDVRNDADHGEFSTVKSHDTQDTHAFVQRFIVDHPA